MAFRVIVVDDSKFVYEELCYLLADTEFEVIKHCRNGVEAVEGVLSCKPDLVTMDIILPDFDGFETAKAIFNKAPDMKMVFISSLAYEEATEQARQMGVEEFIFKPFEKEQILKSFRKVLGIK